MSGLAMAASSSAPRIVRFGVFEFNRESGELRKHGLRIKLQGQPIHVLALLLERPGEVVSREELQKRLWQADTFVDFEHSLNAAIKRLRAALGDSADSPRFIETLARRGYRFIAPLTQAAASPERRGARTGPRTAGARGAARFPACRRHRVGRRVGRGSRPYCIGRAETSRSAKFDPLPGRTSAGEPLGRSGSGLLSWKA